MQSSKELRDLIIKDVRIFKNNTQQSDDTTLVVIQNIPMQLKLLLPVALLLLINSILQAQNRQIEVGLIGYR